MPVNEQLKKAIGDIKHSFRLKQADVAEKLGVKSTYLSDMINGRVPFSDSMKEKLREVFSYNVDAEHGDVLREKHFYGGEDFEESKGRLIPLYEDVSSIGGNNDIVANIDGVSEPTEYIDTGDWFREATAAIRHYGESMMEYPTGCILAIKEVYDRELIMPGRDYVIETSEYRVTKRVQRGQDKEHIAAYSTNSETYADGRLIHEPFDIPLRAVARISLVLGYVVKKNGGAMVYSQKGR